FAQPLRHEVRAAARKRLLVRGPRLADQAWKLLMGRSKMAPFSNPAPIAEILLIEDNPLDVRLTREAIGEARNKARLSTAADGAEGLAFLRREGRFAAAPRPDLILLDLNLPRMSGVEVLAAIKRDPALRNIPVVVLSTSQSENDIERAYDLHVNCYVTKPIDVW